jgi:acetyl esterase/lipase
VWDRTSNITGWSALLGDRRGTADVSIYAAPARATDLSGLPPAFIDCGSVEVFRDEDVAYATALWHAGTQAELHVWPGGFHGFDQMAPQSAIGQAMVAARDAWVARLLSQ